MAKRKQWEDLALLGVIGFAIYRNYQAKADAQAALAPKVTPGISPNPPQTYTVSPGWKRQTAYMPYAGFMGSGQQPGSDTGAFHG